MGVKRGWAGRLAVGAVMLAGLSGCATLSEEECRTGDWRAIGFEDGVAGREAARLGDHRKACAKHGVPVDLASYNAGRAEGLEQYCQPHNGYRVGLNGSSYRGVCPAPLADAFVFAYDYGRNIHDVNASLRAERREIDRLHDAYHAIDDEILQKETLLVSPGLSPTERVALLADIKHLHQEKRDLETDMAMREQAAEDLQYHLSELQTRSPY